MSAGTNHGTPSRAICIRRVPSTELLSQGQFAALAMHLAQDPEAIGPVSNFLSNQRAADINHYGGCGASRALAS